MTGDAVTAGHDIDHLSAGLEGAAAGGDVTGEIDDSRQDRIGDTTIDVGPTGGRQGGGTSDPNPERRSQ